jgi:hypothetical protein
MVNGGGRNKRPSRCCRIRELEAALADAHMDYCLESAFFGYRVQASWDEYGGVKKKNVITLAGVRKRKGIA